MVLEGQHVVASNARSLSDHKGVLGSTASNYCKTYANWRKHKNANPRKRACKPISSLYKWYVCTDAVALVRPIRIPVVSHLCILIRLDGSKAYENSTPLFHVYLSRWTYFTRLGILFVMLVVQLGIFLSWKKNEALGFEVRGFFVSRGIGEGWLIGGESAPYLHLQSGSKLKHERGVMSCGGQENEPESRK